MKNCYTCFECEDAGKQVHDVFLCTGHNSRPASTLEGGEDDEKT